MKNLGFSLIEVLLAMTVGAALVGIALALYMQFAKPSIGQLKETIAMYDVIASAIQYSSFSSKGCFPKDSEQLSKFLGDENYLTDLNAEYSCAPGTISVSMQAQTSRSATKASPLLASMFNEAFVEKVDSTCTPNGNVISCEIKPVSSEFCCE